MFKNLAEVQKANKKLGRFWFAPATMKYFNTKIHGELVAGKYFITSEDNFDRTKRIFSIRIVDQFGGISTYRMFPLDIALASKSPQALGHYPTLQDVQDALDSLISFQANAS